MLVCVREKGELPRGALSTLPGSREGIAYLPDVTARAVWAIRRSGHVGWSGCLKIGAGWKRNSCRPSRTSSAVLVGVPHLLISGRGYRGRSLLALETASTAGGDAPVTEALATPYAPGSLGTCPQNRGHRP